MGDLRLTVDGRTLEAAWLDENPETRAALEAALPISGHAARWGEELYLTIEVEDQPAETRTEVEPGTIAYWPAGPAICLFWGPTPASTGELPAAASPVGPVARVDDITPLADVDGGAALRIEHDD